MSDYVPYAILPKSGSLIAASITGTTAATANTIFTLLRSAQELVIAADFNTSVMVTFNGVDFQYLPAGGSTVRDFGSDHAYAPAGSVIGAYYISGTPTAGRIYVQVT